MPLKIIRADITTVTATAIVNTANHKPSREIYGTDKKIHEAAGFEELFKAREEIGIIEFGEAKRTAAFKLNATHIIHTVAPIWQDGNHDEENLLRQCYRNSLKLALDLKCGSIAFPVLATGINGFQKKNALLIAVTEILHFVVEHDITVLLVVFDEEIFKLSEKLLGNIQNDLTSETIAKNEHEEYGKYEGGLSSLIRDQKSNDPRMQSFKEYLDDLIKEKGLTLGKAIRKAYLAPKLKNDMEHKAEKYHPKIETVVAFAFALELSLEETQKLLAVANPKYKLTNDNKFGELVIKYIHDRNYDIFEINEELNGSGLRILGYKSHSDK